MSTDQTANLGLPFLMPAQAQKHVTVNESLLRLDALVQLAVESRSVSAQPGSPADGAVWIAPAGKTGPEWGGYADWSLAHYRDGAWEPIAPRQGWRAWVKDEECAVTWTGSAWSAALAVASIELGHASDTTITRSAAGVIAVEGGAIPKENRINSFSQRQEIRVSGSTAANSAARGLVLVDESASSGFSIIGSNTSIGRLGFGDPDDNFVGWLQYDHATDDLQLGANNATRVQIFNGMRVGSPTGGDKGAGTINATAVYDDNALLSCYPLAAAVARGRGVTAPEDLVELAVWDARVPDAVLKGASAEIVPQTRLVRRSLTYVEVRDGVAVQVTREQEVKEELLETLPLVDEAGAPVVEQVDARRLAPDDPALAQLSEAERARLPSTPEPVWVSRQRTVQRPVMVEVPAGADRIEPRIHDGARRFAARLGTKHDPLTLDGYAAHWREKLHLTSMPNEASFDPEAGLPTGAWIQRLVETVEIQAVLIEELNQGLKALEGARTA